MQFSYETHGLPLLVLSSADKAVPAPPKSTITAAVENIWCKILRRREVHIDDLKVQDVCLGATRQLLRAVNSRGILFRSAAVPGCGWCNMATATMLQYRCTPNAPPR